MVDDLPPFKAMLIRLARDTKFSMFNDNFRNGMVAEYKRKYKNYPRFRRMLAKNWKRYMKNQVAKFILENRDEIFYNWFCKMFFFDPERMKILEPNTRSDVDFNAKFHYTFKKDEITFIEDLIEKYEIKFVKPLVIMNQLILTGLRLLGPIIEDYFKRPYDFQPENVEDEDGEDGKTVKIFFSSREA
ncbi:MAG: hypothetical protein ACTSUE_04335 [Promethearchaeota archaeon]